MADEESSSPPTTTNGEQKEDTGDTPIATEGPADAAVQLNKKKRLCRHPGCTKVIKSQGHCQRHGAKAKRCKVDGCDKQAQGTHDGMCKRHWKAVHWPESAGSGGNPNTARKEDLIPPAPEGESIYDSVLPQSISYRPTLLNKANLPELKPGEDPPPPPSGVSVMPLVGFLREGATNKEVGWHRNAERRARGLFPISNLSVQLEPWERQLALVEILLLSGGTPYANYRDLAHAWGRDKGFHQVIINNVCERRGEVERKRRCDAGRPLSDERLENFRSKYKRSRTDGDGGGEEQAMVLPSPGGAAAEGGGEGTGAATTVNTMANNTSMAPPPNVPNVETTEI